MLQKDYPNVQADDQDASKQRFLDSVNQLLAFVFVLLFLSIIISGFGILKNAGMAPYELQLEVARTKGYHRLIVEDVSLGFDELGYYAVEDKCEIYDLYATVQHLLGIDHEKLVMRHNGADRRLTDVHGHVIRDLLAFSPRSRA